MIHLGPETIHSREIGGNGMEGILIGQKREPARDTGQLVSEVVSRWKWPPRSEMATGQMLEGMSNHWRQAWLGSGVSCSSRLRGELQNHSVLSFA